MNGTIMDLTHGTGNVCTQVRYTPSLESEEQILIMHRNGSVSAFYAITQIMLFPSVAKLLKASYNPGTILYKRSSNCFNSSLT